MFLGTHAAIAAIPILFAITLHEAAHGYVARHFGDMTAYQQGRISLNPIRHIDLVGTILLPMLTLWMGGILFGWAKPVPVNFAALRRPKQDMLWVALAGPLANLFMAIFWAALAKLALTLPANYFAAPLLGMAQIGIKINVVLMVLNLLPLPPLDVGRMAVSLQSFYYAHGLHGEMLDLGRRMHEKQPSAASARRGALTGHYVEPSVM
jgi:Zn-dependent protease